MPGHLQPRRRRSEAVRGLAADHVRSGDLSLLDRCRPEAIAAAAVVDDIAHREDVRVGRPHPVVDADPGPHLETCRLRELARSAEIPVATRHICASIVPPSSSSTPVTPLRRRAHAAPPSRARSSMPRSCSISHSSAPACSSSCRLSGHGPRSSTSTRTSSCAMLYAASSPRRPAPTTTAARQRRRRMCCWIWTASSIVRSTKLPSLPKPSIGGTSGRAPVAMTTPVVREPLARPRLHLAVRTVDRRGGHAAPVVDAARLGPVAPVEVQAVDRYRLGDEPGDRHPVVEVVRLVADESELGVGQHSPELLGRGHPRDARADDDDAADRRSRGGSARPQAAAAGAVGRRRRRRAPGCGSTTTGPWMRETHAIRQSGTEAEALERPPLGRAHRRRGFPRPRGSRTGSEPHIPMRQPDSIGTWLASAMSSSLSPIFARHGRPGSNATETSPA